MFKKGDYVVYGMSGVCFVEDVTNAPFGQIESRTYYVLKPISTASGSFVFAPVDSGVACMRPLMTEEDIHRLREGISETEIIPVEKEKKRRDVYKSILVTNEPRNWLRIIRTVGERRRTFHFSRKRLPEVDVEFESSAKRHLFNEIAIVLGTTSNEVSAIFMRRMRECFPDMAEA